MSKKEAFKRYFLFLLSVVLQGCAIASITFADIGTTPVSSANYVFSLHSDYTFGETSLIFNILLIVLQIMFIAIGPDSFKAHWLTLPRLKSWNSCFIDHCIANYVLHDLLENCSSSFSAQA